MWKISRRSSGKRSIRSSPSECPTKRGRPKHTRSKAANLNSRYLAGLFAVLGALLLAARNDSPRLAGAGARVIASDDAGGLIVHHLASRKDRTARLEYLSEVTIAADCCSSNAQWAMSAELPDAAVMCPDAAKTLLAKDDRYLLIGPCLYNSDVLVVRPENGSPKFAVMQNRARQGDMLRNVHSVPETDIVPMIPGGIPYALERGFVRGGVVDVLAAFSIPGRKEPLARGESAATGVLVVSRRFRSGKEWSAFALAWNETIAELSTDEGLRDAVAGYRNLRLNREETDLWKKLRVVFAGIPR